MEPIFNCPIFNGISDLNITRKSFLMYSLELDRSAYNAVCFDMKEKQIMYFEAMYVIPLSIQFYIVLGIVKYI